MSKISVAEQYLALKEKHPEEFVFFQIGEFYELLFEDAIKAANLLNINLTKRGKFREQDIPLCGIPIHALDIYVNKLLKNKNKVAIYKQSKDEDNIRVLSRIYTPGTLLSDELLEGKKNNFLFCITLNNHVKDNKKLECAIADLSTGEVYYKIASFDMLDALLLQWNPSEILISKILSLEVKMEEIISVWQSYITIMEEDFFKVSDSILEDFYSITEIKNFPSMVLLSQSIKGLLHYAQYTQALNNKELKTPKELIDSEFMHISKNSRINLELSQTMTGEKEGSLLLALNRTATAVGSRWLIRQLNAPLLNEAEINSRLDHVEFFLNNYELQNQISDKFHELPDIERAAHRIICKVYKKNDFFHMKQGLNILKQIHEIIKMHINRNLLLADLDQAYENLSNLQSLFDKYISDQDDFINIKANDAIHKLYEAENSLNHMLFMLENEYKTELEIKNLKIKYQMGVGYFIEVPLKESVKMTYSFKLMQNLASSKRYMTGALEDVNLKHQQILLNKQQIEKDIINELCEKTQEKRLYLYKLYELLGQLDTFLAFAKVAKIYGLVRPVFSKQNCLKVKQGYHLSISANKTFKPNDIEMEEGNSTMILTGPNMSGKSTYMRQNAQLIVLAQIGSFVSAKDVVLSITDAIFTRIGAYDDITQGKSTFMCEMSELSQILENATEKSFILLDEIGRGTTPKEGQAIAQAVLEHIVKHIKAKTIFATHFCDISKNIQATNIQNKKMESKQINENDIEFLYKLVDGVSTYSYGIAVAKKAGLNNEILTKAMLIYKQL